MKSETEKVRILFLCTKNSCRSQMAEAWARHLKGDWIEPFSAGTEPGAVDPRAIEVMTEAGVNMSGHASKGLDALAGVEFDYVITLCDSASENCPFHPARTRIVHAPFDDPPLLASGAAGEEEALNHYRRVRDEIRAFVETLPGVLIKEAHT